MKLATSLLLTVGLLFSIPFCYASEGMEDCYKYQRIIEDELDIKSNSNPPTGTHMVYKLDKVFYSAKADACLSEIKTTVIKDGITTHQIYKLKNCLTNEIVAGTGLIALPLSKEALSEIDAYREIVKTYE